LPGKGDRTDLTVGVRADLEGMILNHEGKDRPTHPRRKPPFTIQEPRVIAPE
jgi:hypothetical protein